MMTQPGSTLNDTVTRCDDARAERRFRLLAEVIPHLVWTVRGDGDCDYVNRRWCAFTGMAAHAARGHRWLEALHPEDRDRLLRRGVEALSTGSPRELEARFLDRDGAAHTMAVHIEPLPADDDDDPGRRWFGTATPRDARAARSGSEDLFDTPVKAPRDAAETSEADALGPPLDPNGARSLPHTLNSPFAFVGVLTPEGTLVAANLTPIQAGGFTCDDVLGKPFWKCPWWNDNPNAQAQLHKAVAEAAAGSTVRFDVDLRMAGDRQRTIDFQISAIRDPEGRITHLVSSAIDITDSRLPSRAMPASEAEVRRQLVELQSTYDNAPIGLSVMDIDLRWVRINERLAEINGIPAADHIGRSVRELLPDLADQAEELLRRVVETGEEILGFEIVGETPAQPGVVRTWVENFHPIRDDNNRILGINVVCEEVTERRHAEAVQREGEARFHTLADNIAQLAWMADPSGAIFWYNQRWYDYTGTTFEDVRGWGWRSLHHPDHVESVVAKFRACIETGEVWEDTFPIRGHDGAYRWFLSRAIPIRDENGAILRWFGTNTDVTEQRAIEAALRESDRRKSEFLAILSHELRNPLAAIRNAVSAARFRSTAKSHAWAVEVVDRQSEHLKHLMDDLLDLTRIDLGKIELRRHPLPLAEAIERAVGSVRPILDEHGHALVLSIDAEGLEVEADPTRLEQILTNLLTNAAKYTPRGGRIEVSVSREGHEAVIAVLDTGVGLTTEMLARIFDMFAQVDPSRDRAQGGLGIGLSLVRSLVELHGGTVAATSAGPGRGSTFTVRLPLATAETPAPKSTALPSARGAGGRPLRILAVDDNVDSTHGLAMLLGRFGHEVHEVHDGPSALKAAHTLRPDVVLLDIGLPGMDGYQVARCLRSDPTTAHATLIALSGYGQEEDQQQSREAGCDHHLVKPVELPALLALLNAAASTSRVENSPTRTD